MVRDRSRGPLKQERRPAKPNSRRRGKRGRKVVGQSRAARLALLREDRENQRKRRDLELRVPRILRQAGVSLDDIDGEALINLLDDMIDTSGDMRH